MKFTLILVTFVILGGTANASGKAEGKSKLRNAELGTDFRFNDAQVTGKFQNGGEALAEVEADKKLINLVEPRPDFKARLKRSEEW